MEYLRLVIGWSLAIFLGLLEAVFLYRVATNQISLKYLISDDRGYASLTFVIAMTLFYLIIAQGKYPDIPNQILGLLGISGGSFVVSKGIQTSYDVGMAQAGKPLPEAKPDDH